MTLPSEEALEAYYNGKTTKEGFEAAYAIDVAPLQSRIAELEALVLNDKKDWETIVAANDAGSKQVAELTAERDRLKEENEKMCQWNNDLMKTAIKRDAELAEARKNAFRRFLS